MHVEYSFHATRSEALVTAAANLVVAAVTTPTWGRVSLAISGAIAFFSTRLCFFGCLFSLVYWCNSAFVCIDYASDCINDVDTFW